jgi:hypothetical protein
MCVYLSQESVIEESTNLMNPLSKPKPKPKIKTGKSIMVGKWIRTQERYPIFLGPATRNSECEKYALVATNR